VHACVDVEDADLFGTARPFVRATGIEVWLDVTEIEVEHSQCARTIHQCHDVVLTSDPAELSGREDVADSARVVRKRDDTRAWRDRFRHGVDVVLRARMRIGLGDRRDGVPES
jgi:hypothetical protein